MRRLLPLAFLAMPAAAQVAPPPEPAPEHLEFQDEGVRMTVPVAIAGAGPFPFIVDTGAQRTVISHQLAATLGLPPGRTVRLTAMTGTSTVGTVIIPSLSVSILGGTRIEAPSLDARDLGAPGILGIDTLQRHAVTIDLDARTMAIVPVTRRAARGRRDPDEIVVRARSLFGQLVVTDAFVGTTRVRVILDTGTVVSMGNEALRRRLLGGRRGTPVRLLSVTGGITEAERMAIPAIRIGEIVINDLPVAVADAAPFRAFGVEDKPAILLGMDALRMFRRVNIDFANKELRLLVPRGTGRLRDRPGGLSSRL